MSIRVLQISKYYFPFLGGTEQVARDICSALSNNKDIEQKIICFNEDSLTDGYKCNKSETKIDLVDGIEIIRCGYEFKVSSQAISLRYKNELKKIMNFFKPNIIILHYPNPFVTSLLLKYKKQPFKLLVYWHLDITKQKILKHLFKWQNIKLINRADLILGATPKHLDESEYSHYFEGKKYILPYSIDEKNLQITEIEKEKAKNIKEKYKEKKIGFFIGRHVQYKGLTYLIEASKQIDIENLVILIAGSGELTEKLKKQAVGDDKICFLGKIDDSDRRAYLYACDFICFPSITRNEGFGLALAEGMYFSKPAITFSIKGSGVNYVNLNNITGIECQNKNIKEYSDALIKMCTNDELRNKLGEAAHKRIIENFTQEKFKENILKLIKKIY